MKRGPKPITERFTIEELLGMRGNGMSNSEIAEVVGCSYATIARYIGKGGIRRKYRVVKKPFVSSINIDEIRKRHENGETMAKIAKDIGCSRATLYKHLKEAKLKVESEETTEKDFSLTTKLLKWTKETVNLTNDHRSRCYTIVNTNGYINVAIQTDCANFIAAIDRNEFRELICAVNLKNDHRSHCYIIVNTNGDINVDIQTDWANFIAIDRDELGELVCELREIQSYIKNRWGEE